MKASGGIPLVESHGKQHRQDWPDLLGRQLRQFAGTNRNRNTLARLLEPFVPALRQHAAKRWQDVDHFAVDPCTKRYIEPVGA